MTKIVEQAIAQIKKSYPTHHLLGNVLENDANYALFFCPDEPDGVNRDDKYLFFINLPLFFVEKKTGKITEINDVDKKIDYMCDRSYKPIPK